MNPIERKIMNGWAYAKHRTSEIWNGPEPTIEQAISKARDDYGAGQEIWFSPTRPARDSDEVQDDWTFICEGPFEKFTT